ncbi:MAG: hypothetical protein GXP63_00625 [DPANN group archaeon]|nr:hypothetical protein [DPANN group archaeon]
MIRKRKMDELEALRQKKLAEMQQQAEMQSQAQQEASQLQAQIEQLEQLARTVLSPEAMQRYAALKLAHPETAVQSLLVIAQLVQAKRLKHLDDAGFKDILRTLGTSKKDITITRR